MKIEMDRGLLIETKTRSLINEILEKRKEKGFKDSDFDIAVTRYLGKPAVAVGNKLLISALDIIALSVPKAEQASFANDLKAFQELVAWSDRLGMDLGSMAGLLSLSSTEREKQIRASLKNVPEEQLSALLQKLKELETHLSSVDKLINKSFPSQSNSKILLFVVEAIEQISFTQRTPSYKRYRELQVKSAELLGKLVKATGAQAQEISTEKGKVDREILNLFVELEPKMTISSKLMAWLFAEDSWEKIKEEKYLWALLARMSEVAARQCSTTWTYTPGRTNILDLVANTHWPKYLSNRTPMEHSFNACKKLASYYMPDLSAQFLFDPFKVDWKLVTEIMDETEKTKVRMFENCMKTYSTTIQSVITVA